jgi:enoyl-CoA hydratase
MSEAPTVTVERDGHVLLLGLNRPAKRNAFNRAMLGDLSRAYAELEGDPGLRCGVVFAHGDHFTGGLDLVDVGPNLGRGGWEWPPDGLDFLGLSERAVTKPVVMAIQGRCLTIGIEMALSADIRIAAEDTRFAQVEIKRGLVPFGGATMRFVRDCGWGNAMMHLLTGDEFNATEALRIGLVQEVVAVGRQLERALEVARVVAEQAPLGVYATLRNARLAAREGEPAAVRALPGEVVALSRSEDVREGLMSFIERREGRFTGR